MTNNKLFHYNYDMSSNREIIKEFCNIQTDTLQNLRTNGRVSILSQISHDLDYSLGAGVTFLELGLNPEQRRLLDQRRISSFTHVLIYCSAIDLMARILYKRPTDRGENGRFFKKSATDLFPFSQAEKNFFQDPDYGDIEPPVKGSYEANKLLQADDMWDFRNALSHSYSLKDKGLKDFEISTSSSTKLIDEKPGNGNTKIIFIRFMRRSLAIAIEDLEKHLLSESEDEQLKTVQFIEKYGFVYVNDASESV